MQPMTLRIPRAFMASTMFLVPSDIMVVGPNWQKYQQFVTAIINICKSDLECIKKPTDFWLIFFMQKFSKDEPPVTRPALPLNDVFLYKDK